MKDEWEREKEWKKGVSFDYPINKLNVFLLGMINRWNVKFHLLTRLSEK